MAVLHRVEYGVEYVCESDPALQDSLLYEFDVELIIVLAQRVVVPDGRAVNVRVRIRAGQLGALTTPVARARAKWAHRHGVALEPRLALRLRELPELLEQRGRPRVIRVAVVALDARVDQVVVPHEMQLSGQAEEIDQNLVAAPV